MKGSQADFCPDKYTNKNKSLFCTGFFCCRKLLSGYMFLVLREIHLEEICSEISNYAI